MSSFYSQKNKLNIVLVGNCQLFPIYKFLLKQDFINAYYLAVHTATNEEVTYLHKRLNECDILINTLTDENYRDNIGLGSKYLSSLVTGGSNSSIIIPCIYYSGYFPTVSSFKQEDALSYNYENGEYQKSKYHDYIPLVLAQNSITDIEYNDLEEKLFSNFIQVSEIVMSNHIKSIERLQHKEISCNLHVSDIIIDLYKTGIHFYANNHPTTEILLPIYERILSRIESNLDIKDKLLPILKNYKLDKLNAHDQVYIHKFVIKSLLNTSINHNGIKDNNILSTITKYYIDSGIVDKNEIKNSAYKNSVKLLKLTGLI